MNCQEENVILGTLANALEHTSKWEGASVTLSSARCALALSAKATVKPSLT